MRRPLKLEDNDYSFLKTFELPVFEKKYTPVLFGPYLDDTRVWGRTKHSDTSANQVCRKPFFKTLSRKLISGANPSELKQLDEQFKETIDMPSQWYLPKLIEHGQNQNKHGDEKR